MSLKFVYKIWRGWLNGNSAVVVNLMQDSLTLPYTIGAYDVSGNCELSDTTLAGVLTPTGQANVYTTVFAGGTVITLTVPGSNAVEYSYAEGGGTTTDHAQLTFDSTSCSINGSINWAHTNGCYGVTTISRFMVICWHVLLPRVPWFEPHQPREPAPWEQLLLKAWASATGHLEPALFGGARIRPEPAIPAGALRRPLDHCGQNGSAPTWSATRG